MYYIYILYIKNICSRREACWPPPPTGGYGILPPSPLAGASERAPARKQNFAIWMFLLLGTGFGVHFG